MEMNPPAPPNLQAVQSRQAPSTPIAAPGSGLRGERRGGESRRASLASAGSENRGHGGSGLRGDKDLASLHHVFVTTDPPCDFNQFWFYIGYSYVIVTCDRRHYSLPWSPSSLILKSKLEVAMD